ncbi:hypothetical protein AVEN_272801-1 [Araneus ventricosus]|uniref:Uncharacterized protein n=1 Tax=Araneus ventricosus TaxID=182803 RepID=A0A4Y2H8K3_ARAVE|nr:hypothetical protein AVEN_272801-1 [Araneus ventricosus]
MASFVYPTYLNSSVIHQVASSALLSSVGRREELFSSTSTPEGICIVVLFNRGLDGKLKSYDDALLARALEFSFSVCYSVRCFSSVPLRTKESNLLQCFFKPGHESAYHFDFSCEK